MYLVAHTELLNEIGKMVENLQQNALKPEDLKTWEDDYEEWAQPPFDDS